MYTFGGEGDHENEYSLYSCENVENVEPPLRKHVHDPRTAKGQSVPGGRLRHGEHPADDTRHLVDRLQMAVYLHWYPRDGGVSAALSRHNVTVQVGVGEGDAVDRSGNFSIHTLWNS